MKFRKHFSAMLAAMILAGSCIAPQTTAFAQEKQELLYGDANVDNEIDVADAVLIARFYAEDWEVSLTATGKKQADVNLDG